MKYQEHGLGADEAAADAIPQGNRKSKGVEIESLSGLVSTQLNKRGSVSLSKVLIISEIHKVFI
jgi:hypothetical protein